MIKLKSDFVSRSQKEQGTRKQSNRIMQKF